MIDDIAGCGVKAGVAMNAALERAGISRVEISLASLQEHGDLDPL